jgi:hypothetical protein
MRLAVIERSSITFVFKKAGLVLRMYFPKTQIILGFAKMRGCDARHPALVCYARNILKDRALTEC